MCTEVYYFSGTGNSLVVARDIAERIAGKLISIPSMLEQTHIETDADMIGIVFPVYHQGLPPIIKRFIAKLSNLENKYIFAVCTYGGSPGISLEYLNKLIGANGGTLAAGFGVQMPYNYITPSFVVKGFLKSFQLREIASEEQQKMFANWRQKLDIIAEYIQARKEGKLEIDAKIIENLVDFFNLRNTLQKNIWLKIGGFTGSTHLPFPECIQLMDFGFTCDDKCASCATCVRICPVHNITQVEGKPTWQHHCEQCFACLQWCPQEAIQFRAGTSQGKRYHHPDVKLADMLCSGK